MRQADVIIIGQGPAGLSAAIYTARAGISTLILGCEPKIAGDYDIDNYFGFPETIPGRELIARGIRQASRFGAVIECDRVLAIHFDGSDGYRVKAERGEYAARAVILATGVSRKKPPVPGHERFEGRGVSYCVSCDGFFYRGKPVMVAGEGVYAANQALELLEYTPDVSVCTLGRPSGITEEYRRQLDARGVPVIDSGIASLEGEGALDAVAFADGTRREVKGLFIAMGDASSVDFARTLGVFTEGGFVQVDREMKTNAPGLFAAGDCIGGFLQISVAVGEGAIAARSAIEYVRALKRAGGV